MVFEKTSWHCFYYACTPPWTNSSVALELGKIIKAVRGWNGSAAAQEPRGPAKNFAAGSQLGIRPIASGSDCHPTAVWKTLYITCSESSFRCTDPRKQSVFLIRIGSPRLRVISQWKGRSRRSKLFTDTASLLQIKKTSAFSL